MNWRTIRAIALKDWREVRGNKMAWAPTLIVPLIFCVVLPLLIIVLPGALSSGEGGDMMKDADLELFLANLPPAIAASIAGLNESQTMIVLLLGYLFSPLFLILPIMTSSVIGSDSFVGEKERKTMEALLYTPATERELFTGKMLAAVIPAVLLTWLGFAVYTLVLNSAGGVVMGRVWFPLPHWWVMVLWVTPAVAVLGMMGAVVISARVKSFMEAYQNTGLLVLPIIMLVISQVAGLLYLSVPVAFGIGLVVWLVDGILLLFALRIITRAALMGADKGT